MNKIVLIGVLLLSRLVCAQEFEFVLPQVYNCNFTKKAIDIDGKIDSLEWSQADWTNYFTDIEGSKKSIPYKRTRAKMLWDNSHLYLAFELEEDHIWSVLKQRDTVIYKDNDIEIFLDMSADGHNYVEYEINANNVLWDLLLVKPYREGGPILDNWDHKGFKSAVHCIGSVNNPSDVDTKWCVEVALPWNGLTELSADKLNPKAGDQMRINFSRVQWESYVENNLWYRKKLDENLNLLPENNWVWSPIMAVDMHRPENWGILNLCDKNQNYNLDKDSEFLRQYLFHIYKKQKSLIRSKKEIARSLKELNLNRDILNKYNIVLKTLGEYFTIEGINNQNELYRVNFEGKFSKTKK